MIEVLQNPMHSENNSDKPLLLFWVYLMTDLLMFSVLFAAYAALHGSTFGGPSGAEIFNLPFVLTETLALLSSSFTCGLAMLYAHAADKKKTIVWLSATFLLGGCFLGMELYEF